MNNLEKMTVDNPEKYLIMFVEMLQKDLKIHDTHKMARLTSQYFKGKIIDGKCLGQNKIYEILPDKYKNLDMKNLVEKRTKSQNEKTKLIKNIETELKKSDIGKLKKLLKLFKNYKEDIVNSTIDEMEEVNNMDYVVKS